MVPLAFCHRQAIKLCLSSFLQLFMEREVETALMG